MEIDLTKQFEQISAEIRLEYKIKLNSGLNKAADHLVKILETSSLTPNDPNNKSRAKGKKYRYSFVAKKNYTNAKFVGNSKMVESADGEVPLSSVLEYGENAKPHMRAVFDGAESELTDIILKEISK